MFKWLEEDTVKITFMGFYLWEITFMWFYSLIPENTIFKKLQVVKKKLQKYAPYPETYSEPCKIYQNDLFAKIVYGF